MREIQERGTAPIVLSPPARALHSYLQLSPAASLILSGLLEEWFILLFNLNPVSICNILAYPMDFVTL